MSTSPTGHRLVRRALVFACLQFFVQSCLTAGKVPQDKAPARPPQGSPKSAPAAKRLQLERDRQRAQAALAFDQARRWEAAGRIEAAEQAYRKAARLWELSGHPAGQADAAYELGRIRIERQRLALAREPLAEAHRLYRGLKRDGMEGYAALELGWVYAELGQPARGRKLYEEALGIARRVGDCVLEVHALKRRIRLDLNLGELGVALESAERAVEMARRCGSREDRAQALNNLGRAYKEMGDPETALRLHLQAKSLLGEAAPPSQSLASTQVHLGDTFRELERWRSSELAYLEAIGIWRRLGRQDQEAVALNNLGMMFHRTRRWRDARDSFLRARRLAQHLEDGSLAAVSALNLAWVLTDLQTYGRAVDLYGEALAFAREEKRRPVEAASYFGLAWTERRRGNLAAAQKYLLKALEALESLRGKADRVELRQKLFAGRMGFYDLQVDILMEKHQREPGKGFDRQAMEASEMARYRTLLDAVEGRIVLPRSSVREIQGLLGDETILLEYFLGERESFLWAVTSEGFSSYSLPPRDRIAGLARSVNSAMAETDKGEKMEHAVSQALELSRILFGPVASRLDRKRLLIVAPPELQYVPFPALPALPLSRSGRRWPMPWVERFEVYGQPSAAFLAHLRGTRQNREPRPHVLALIARPVFAGEASGNQREFPELLFSGEEARRIARAAGGAATAFLGHDANRELILSGSLRGFRLVHISAHGLTSPDSPGDSALVLSQVNGKGQRINGYVWAPEIARLDLPADLVVLSACGTGLGAEIRGEGLVGLSHAFFSAGAASVLPTLWDVDDLGTVHLMDAFYQNLFQKKLPSSAALRDAQRNMWRQERWNPPYFWGGFMLQGEWRSSPTLPDRAQTDLP